MQLYLGLPSPENLPKYSVCHIPDLTPAPWGDTMAQQAEKLVATRRNETGKRRMRRLRAAGSIPAVLYGHGEESVSIAVNGHDFETALRHGSRLVDLTGDMNESALISDVQWDTFGQDPLHIDFVRVSKGEKVDVTVALELRGVAPGTSEGGVVTQPTHEIEINCPVTDIPEHVEVNINHLELNGQIVASDLELPEGATLLIPEDQLIAECIVPTVVEEEEAPAAEGAEPEVIGRADEEEGGGDDS